MNTINLGYRQGNNLQVNLHGCILEVKLPQLYTCIIIFHLVIMEYVYVKI